MTDHHEPAPPHGDNDADVLAIPGDRLPWLVCAPAVAGGDLSPQLAQLILDAYTTTNDVVIDVDNDKALAAAATQTGRRHHALAGLAGLTALDHAAGYIDLMLLRWPQPSVDPHWLFLTCRTLLRHAGHLVLAVSGDQQHRIAILSALSGAARTADLHIVDHVVVLTPQTDTPHDTSTATASPAVHTDLLVLATQRPS